MTLNALCVLYLRWTVAAGVTSKLKISWCDARCPTAPTPCARTAAAHSPGCVATQPRPRHRHRTSTQHRNVGVTRSSGSLTCLTGSH